MSGQAAECAAKQNQFWPYHDKLFSAQGVRTAYTADSLKKYAVDLGLNASAFNTCLDTGETQFKVRNDSEEGANRGVRSTPTAFINGQMVVGTQEIDAYRKIINAALQ